jgi:hypothetical protein
MFYLTIQDGYVQNKDCSGQAPYLLNVYGAYRTPVAQHCRAVKRSLGQLDLRSLGNGRYLMPVLDPARDSLPFAMALELHERTSGAEDNCPSLLWGQAQPEEGLYALRYMLDCEPQVCLTKS